MTSVNVSDLLVEVVHTGTPGVAVSRLSLEVVHTGTPGMAASRVILEVVHQRSAAPTTAPWFQVFT